MSSITVARVLGHVPAPTRRGHSHDRFARWAVRLSTVCGAAFAASIAALAIAYAVGVESAFEDTLLGWLLGIMAFTGFLGSFVAFLVALVAKITHEQRPVLWLPLCVFPALLAFLVLGEAFWWA